LQAGFQRPRKKKRNSACLKGAFWTGNDISKFGPPTFNILIGS
jgi:hypothetical protein